MVPMALEINNVRREILWSLFAAFHSEKSLVQESELVAHAQAKLPEAFTIPSS